MTKQKATNITWHTGAVSGDDRLKLHGHKGVCLWFTGLSGSGKSTVACAVERALHSRGCRTYMLDGDNIRHGLNKDLGFSPEDRQENIRRIGEVAHLFVDSGTIVTTAFISPYVRDRDLARSLHDKGQFVEIYCECPLDVCEQRDPKGLYKKARAGQIKEFTGIDAPYEPPQEPEILINTARQDLDDCVAEIVGYLEKNGLLMN